MCKIDAVAAVEQQAKRKPIKSVKIEDRKVKVLIDTGATANVMDEHIYKRYLADKVKLRKLSSVFSLTRHCWKI